MAAALLLHDLEHLASFFSLFPMPDSATWLLLVMNWGACVCKCVSAHAYTLVMLSVQFRIRDMAAVGVRQERECMYASKCISPRCCSSWLLSVCVYVRRYVADSQA
jgi:hypothetical protein